MSDHSAAHLCFITNPAPREAVLNVQVQNEELLRFNLNRDQLFALNAKSADILMRDFK